MEEIEYEPEPPAHLEPDPPAAGRPERGAAGGEYRGDPELGGPRLWRGQQGVRWSAKAGSRRLDVALGRGPRLDRERAGPGQDAAGARAGPRARLPFNRIQFTPDLMPSDVTGSPIYDERINDFRFRPGPVFTQILLADEINRAPAKTHSALLEIMQENRVTIDGVSYPIEPPFLVMATQNPIESEGTYNLPEAQLDRFLFKLVVEYPSAAEETEILRLHTRGFGSDRRRGRAA